MNAPQSYVIRTLPVFVLAEHNFEILSNTNIQYIKIILGILSIPFRSSVDKSDSVNIIEC